MPEEFGGRASEVLTDNMRKTHALAFNSMPFAQRAVFQKSFIFPLLDVQCARSMSEKWLVEKKLRVLKCLDSLETSLRGPHLILCFSLVPKTNKLRSLDFFLKKYRAVLLK